MNRSIAIGMVLGMALVAGLWMIVSSQGLPQRTTPGPEKVVAAFLDAARAGDVDGMLDAVRSETIRGEIERQRYMIVWLVHEDAARRGAPSPIPGAGPVFDFRYDAVKERSVTADDTARVVMRLYRRGSEVLTEYRLSRRDGHWKIDSVANVAEGGGSGGSQPVNAPPAANAAQPANRANASQPPANER